MEEQAREDKYILGTYANRRWMIAEPMIWHSYHLEQANKHKVGIHKYFITFTKNGEVDITKWKQRIVFELGRRFVKTFIAAVEHADDNIHVHALITTTIYLKKTLHFKTFTNHYGFIDLKNVKYDNGVQDYLKKENEPVTDLTALTKQLNSEASAQRAALDNKVSDTVANAQN